MRWLVVVVAMCSCLAGAMGEQPSLSVTWRVRLENWRFFEVAGRDNDYAFAASLIRAGITSKAGKRQDWQLELSQVTFAGLPANAVAPSHGATYRAVNGGRDGSIFIKQAFWRWRSEKDATLRLGRFEFADGAERMPKDETLSWLRRSRIQERLIGPFGFSHIQRSFDGLHLNVDRKEGTFSLLLARPTRGAFDLKGNDQISKVTLLYGSWTTGKEGERDWRFFALHYRDTRDIVKTSNKPNVRGDLTITTLGLHSLWTGATRTGKWDALLWGAWQFGDYGHLDHKAYAFALEAGHRWTKTPWRPWLRVGYFAGTGDDNPNDGKHETFFQIIPTPRIYARFPIYNLMNNRDLFGQLMLTLNARTSLRLDYHRLWLTEGADLWYFGGGAFNHTLFGYGGRPSGGHTRLMDVVDLSVDYRLDPQTTLTLYGARALGKDVVRAQTDFVKRNATYVYLELLRRW